MSTAIPNELRPLNFFPGSETPFLFTYFPPIVYTKRGAFAADGEPVYSGPISGVKPPKKSAVAGTPDPGNGDVWSEKQRRYMSPSEAAFARSRHLF